MKEVDIMEMLTNAIEEKLFKEWKVYRKLAGDNDG